jgi:hypothetical protein
MRDSRTQTNESLSFWPRCAKRLGVRCLGTALKRGKAASSRRTPQPSALFSEQATLSTRFVLPIVRKRIFLNTRRSAAFFDLSSAVE